MDTEVTWPEEARCTQCKHLKAASEFNKDRRKRNGLSSWCKTCHSAALRANYARPEVKARDLARKKARSGTPEARAVQWRASLKYSYCITPEEYEQMLTAQGGGCAICGRRPKNRRLSVDHDHSCCPGTRSCGKCIRGLLCVQCNHKVLGYWLHEGTEGTEQALRKARNLVAYLERSQDARAERAA